MERAHKSLDVWREGVELCAEIYKLTSTFPRAEEYGLSSQMRRAVVSIPSNIAEGAARGSVQEFIRFLNIAMGSLSELDTQMEIAQTLGYVRPDSFATMQQRVERLGAKLAALIRKMKSKANRHDL